MIGITSKEYYKEAQKAWNLALKQILDNLHTMKKSKGKGKNGKGKKY